MNKAIDDKYLYSDLSYEIIGAAQEAQNRIGAGAREETYQKAVITALRSQGKACQEEVRATIALKSGDVIDRRFDAIVDDKVVVEFKVGSHIGKSEYEQVKEYLNISKYQLGLIILFSYKGVSQKRVLRPDGISPPHHVDQ